MTPSELWEQHLDYADNLAAQYVRSVPLCVQLDDLKQASRLGLWKAANSYQEDKGRFKTYAYYFIQHELTLERVRHLPWNPAAYHHNNEGSPLPDFKSLSITEYQIAAPEVSFDVDVIRLIQRLPDTARMFATMFWIDGLSNQEISRRTGRCQEYLRGMRKRIISWLKVIADQEC